VDQAAWRRVERLKEMVDVATEGRQRQKNKEKNKSTGPLEREILLRHGSLRESSESAADQR